MHAWQPGRLAAVFADAERAGLTKSDLARIAGVHRSQVSRWASGDQRPGYDRAMRMAGYLRRDHPDLADELTAASGYGGPVEPEAEPDVPADVLRAIRKTYDPERQRQAIEMLETLTSPRAEAESSPARDGQADLAG